MKIEDLLQQVFGNRKTNIDPNIPTGAYQQINPFTGNPMAGGWYLDSGICPLFEEYVEVERPTFPQGPELIEESEV